MTALILDKTVLQTTAGRERLSLDGAWDFQLDGHGGWRKAVVPGPWQAQFSDLRYASGVATYVRNIKIPKTWHDRQIAIRFGAVSYFAEIFLNGAPIGSHEGSYLPFECVIPKKLLADENRLEVRVTLPDGDENRYPKFPFAEIPHGKQSWYGALGGIWQSVSLEARDRRHIASCRVQADVVSGTVLIETDQQLSCVAVLIAEIVAPHGDVAVFETTFSGVSARIIVNLPNRQAWSPELPNLYQLTLRLKLGDEIIDTLKETFGFRNFENRDGKFYLNGEPFYLRGALDQDYYPDGICTPPSIEFLEDQIRKAKALGLNMLRCHIKVPDPRYLEVADRLGMLIWMEIPNVETFSEQSARRLRETMEGILARDRNHPSIVVWTIINEDWGTRLREAPEQRQWLVKIFDWLKQADPTRLVVDNSPCAPNYHIKTDINDFHYYRSIPERRNEWDRLTQEFASNADWTYTPHGDAVRSGSEPLVLSEFGVWGLPHPDALGGDDGTDPWWFSGGEMWGDGAASPHGMEQRFSALRLDSVFGSFDAFIDAAQWYQFENLKYQIESLREYQSIAGYVVTELTDVHWEANGLMDIERNPRVFHKRFAEINADIIVVPGLKRWAYWAQEVLSIVPKIAVGGKALPAGSALKWSIGTQSGHIDIRASEPLTVRACGSLNIRLPSVKSATMMDLHFRVRGPDGDELAINRVSIAVHPVWDQKSDAPTVASNDPKLAKRLVALGYILVVENEADVFVTRRLDAERIEEIRLGQKVLLLAENGDGYLRQDDPPREQPHLPIIDDISGIPSQPYFSFPGYSLINRDNTMWRGDWVTNFSWLKRKSLFAALPGGPMLDLTFDRVVPRAVITGFRPWEFEGRVQAGVVVGWIHKPAATIIEKSFGRGKLVATTFRLTEDAPCVDPTATVLTDCLLRQTAE